MKQKQSEIQKFAIASLLSSVAAAALIAGGMFEVLDLTVSAVASLAVVIAVIELRGKYPYFVYAVPSVLALILMPRSATLYFVCFLGYYPILKAAVARLNRFFSWAVKLSAFNTSAFLMFFLFQSIFSFPALSWYYTTGLLIAANAFFIAYDTALSGLITLYIVKIRSALKFKNLF